MPPGGASNLAGLVRGRSGDPTGGPPGSRSSAGSSAASAAGAGGFAAVARRRRAGFAGASAAALGAWLGGGLGRRRGFALGVARLRRGAGFAARFGSGWLRGSVRGGGAPRRRGSASGSAGVRSAGGLGDAAVGRAGPVPARRPAGSSGVGSSARPRLVGGARRGVRVRLVGLRAGPARVRAGSGSRALGGRLVQQDRPRDGRVERLDPAVHRDPDQQVAAPADGRAEAPCPRCRRRSRSARGGRRRGP